MAEKLVTQVRNPDGLDGEDEAYIQVEPNEDDLKENPPSPAWAKCVAFWQDCWAGCLVALRCCPRPAPARVERSKRRFSIGGGRKNCLLPPQPPVAHGGSGKKTLVLDLDETLVHSSFKPVQNADFVLSIELEGESHFVYVLKRPGVDEFLRAVAKRWEVVVFTASVEKYADPLLDVLDKQGLVSTRLFREACVQHYGNYVKDLSQMGRELSQTIIIDNSPFSYIFQPDNAIAVSSWFSNPNDRQLFDLIPIMDELADARDVVQYIANKNNRLLADHLRHVEATQLEQQRVIQQAMLRQQRSLTTNTRVSSTSSTGTGDIEMTRRS